MSGRKRNPIRRLTTGDKYKPVTREDVTDLNLLPKRFDQFVAETRTSFELLTEKIVAPLVRIQESISDLVMRVVHVEERLTAVERAQVDAAVRIAALEAIQPQPRRNSSRKKTRQ